MEPGTDAYKAMHKGKGKYLGKGPATPVPDEESDDDYFWWIFEPKGKGKRTPPRGCAFRPPQGKGKESQPVMPRGSVGSCLGGVRQRAEPYEGGKGLAAKGGDKGLPGGKAKTSEDSEDTEEGADEGAGGSRWHQKCQNPQCTFAVSNNREMGDYCCKRCHWQTMHSDPSQPLHGTQCEHREASMPWHVGEGMPPRYPLAWHSRPGTEQQTR